MKPEDLKGNYEIKIDIKKSVLIEKHCESCASWGDCPCGDKMCRYEKEEVG